MLKQEQNAREGTNDAFVKCLFVTNLVQLHDQKVSGLVEDEKRVPEYKQQLELMHQNKPTTSDAIKKERELTEKVRLIESGENVTKYLLDSMHMLNKFHHFHRELDLNYENLEKRHQILDEINRITNQWERCFMPKIHAQEDCRDPNYVWYSEDQMKPDWDFLPPKHFAYKRINHFREYLRQQQGKCKVVVPPEIVKELRANFALNMWNVLEANPNQVRALLKKSGKHKYYEHVHSITQELSQNNYMPLQISAEHEETLCCLFVKTEAPFLDTKDQVNKTRVNFLSYPYITRKLCELACYDVYVNQFEMLKSDKRLIVQDLYWREICDSLGWQFIRTIGRIM